MSANTKGGSVPFAGTDIHLTSNYLPNRWWSEKTKFNEDALFRRITIVHWHYDYMKYHLYNSDQPGHLEGCAMSKFVTAYRKEFPLFVQ